MFFRRLNWNVVGWFRIVSLISYAIILAGLVAMGYNWATKGQPLRLGLSFTGGTDVSVKFKDPATPGQIAAALANIGVKDAQINTLGGAGDSAPSERFTIQTQTAFGNDTGKLWGALGNVGAIDRSQSQIESVGPSLSQEYLAKAVQALIIAIAIQFLYIAFRFGWNYIFGLVVVVALVRDSLMMIGIYAIANRRADDAFLAAVLTVIGYSVMDTIVILDRIRENAKLMAGEPYAKIVNTSILQTMTRSVNTLATVVVTLVALLAFGGASLQNFAFALLVGVCSGGYHSIFYSAPLVVVLREPNSWFQRLIRWTAQRVGAGIPTDANLERPRTVAEARAQAASAVDREAILAARKERRSKEKEQLRGPTAPPRYKKRRSETVTPLAVDPLDAERAGLHDQALAMGHEEIRLDFGDEAASPEPAPHAPVEPKP